MTEQTRIGVIGVGRWGINMVRTFDPIASVAWLCATRDESIVRALDVVKPRGTPRTTTSAQDVFNDPTVDAVVISTPASTHYALTRAALLAGKHVLVEKPFVLRSVEATELHALATAVGKILMVGHVHLYNPAIRRLKQDIDAGMFGALHYVDSIGAGPGPVRTDMSAPWDYFPHDISIALYLFGRLPDSVSAYALRATSMGVVEAATMVLAFGDVRVHCFCSWAHPLKKRELVLVGERRSATFDDYNATEKLRYFEKGTMQGTAQAVDGDRPLTLEAQHFLDCIRTGTPPLTGAAEAGAVIRVLEAFDTSMRLKGVVVPVLH